MGRIYGLGTLPLVTLLIVAGVGGAYFGYRSRPTE